MPNSFEVEAFIAQVVSGDHVGAIRDWYHDDAWMQENQSEPRMGGRAALMAHEQSVLDRCAHVETELLDGPLVTDEVVAIRWRFTFSMPDGGKVQIEEVAWQTWRGDKIAKETFFYDPAQRRTIKQS